MRIQAERHKEGNRENFQNSLECAPPFLFLLIALPTLASASVGHMPGYYQTTVYFQNMATWPGTEGCLSLSCAWNVHLSILSCQNSVFHWSAALMWRHQLLFPIKDNSLFLWSPIKYPQIYIIVFIADRLALELALYNSLHNKIQSSFVPGALFSQFLALCLG